jgi:hypothetical protein
MRRFRDPNIIDPGFLDLGAGRGRATGCGRLATLGRQALALIGAGILSGFFASLPVAAQARPLVPAERRYDWFEGRVPACDDPNVFERIQSRFQAREGEFWKSGLLISGFDRVREIGMRSNGLDLIPRRYCEARAFMNDGKLRTVSYTIAEDMGIIGWGFGVDWCVSGLDRNYAYAPNCKMARP